MTVLRPASTLKCLLAPVPKHYPHMLEDIYSTRGSSGRRVSLADSICSRAETYFDRSMEPSALTGI
jgi:hypothetical protein